MFLPLSVSEICVSAADPVPSPFLLQSLTGPTVNGRNGSQLNCCLVPPPLLLIAADSTSGGGEQTDVSVTGQRIDSLIKWIGTELFNFVILDQS